MFCHNLDILFIKKKWHCLNHRRSLILMTFACHYHDIVLNNSGLLRLQVLVPHNLGAIKVL